LQHLTQDFVKNEQHGFHTASNAKIRAAVSALARDAESCTENNNSRLASPASPA
jgi:hypothetical protein